MKKTLSVLALAGTAMAIAAVSEQATKPKIDSAQIPKWSADDLDFFLHGSMSTEVVPEPVLKTFIKIYPDLFPAQNLAYLGLIPDPQFGWPIGFSKKKVSHLGDLPSLGLNCAACHTAEIRVSGSPPLRILGVTSHFDAEAFFGGVVVATFKTSEPANMKLFLNAYFPNSGVDAAWDAQQAKITETMAADPFGAKGLEPGDLHKITATDLELGKDAADLPKTAQSFLKLFHNMRAALHIPDQPPDKAPPSSGPGRNDAFGLLSAGLFNAPQPFAPVKYGLVWNVGERRWVHWDGNTRSPIGRNLLASLGLGAPLHGKRGDLDFALVKRQTDITEQIKPPKYPFTIDQAAAKRGAAQFNAHCASCHGGDETDKRLYSAAEVGTDPLRAQLFTTEQAGRFNKFLAELESQGYQPAKEEGLRSTGKYWAATLSGVWARSPYLHNGSVRTMHELLMPAAQRTKTFKRGSQDYDTKEMGYTDGGPYVFDTSMRGNANTGHEYGTKLSVEEKRELMEYLKTL